MWRGVGFWGFSLCVVAITNNLALPYECVIFTMYVGYDSCDWSVENSSKFPEKNAQVLWNFHDGSMQLVTTQHAKYVNDDK